MPIDPMRDEPIVPEAPDAPPAAPAAPTPPPAPVTPPPADSPEAKAEESDRLFDLATKAQRAVEDLISAIRDEKPEKEEEQMTPEEGDAAGKALIGL